ncbi:DUF1853 family protein [Spongiimicrobium salis]|uniref:DUF1853 family protein n=1 Tax=Spongiimicrobium salis TaxID=1667022 RepID=UPI00374CEBEC
MQDDLAFYKAFMETPPLWEGVQFKMQQFAFPTLDLAQFKPTPIPGNIRLGHQIEHVFQQLLRYDASYEILLHNIPIRRNKTTLGEIDFLLRRTSTLELIHVELTYKFYIIDTSLGQVVKHLSGANRVDLFHKKLEKIQEKQFPLVDGPEAQAILKEHLIEDRANLQHHVCFKAQLFVPYATSKLPSIAPLNPACIVGEWMSISVFKKRDFVRYDYYFPSKRERVLPPHKSVAWVAYNEALASLEHYMSQKKAVLLWQKQSATVFKKFFIVWW